MRWNPVALAILLAGIVLGPPAQVAANHLAAPTNVSCSGDGTDLVVDWDDVVGSVKYSVNVSAGYDLDGDTAVDATVSFDFGTSDRTDGAPISQSDLTIPLASLVSDVDGDLDLDAPVQVDVRVKTLHPGRYHGRQNSAFSVWASCTGDVSP